MLRKYQDTAKFPRSGPSFDEFVSHTPDAEDVARVRRVVLDLPADIGDMAVYCPGGDGNVVFAPDAVKEIVALQYLSFSFNKEL